MSDIIPFGKYKGQPLEVLRNDRQYLDWLMAQDWFRAKYESLCTIIINNFGEPAETPEHNAMQARFLDLELAGVLYDFLRPEVRKNNTRMSLANFKRRELERQKKAWPLDRSKDSKEGRHFHPADWYEREKWGWSDKVYYEQRSMAIARIDVEIKKVDAEIAEIEADGDGDELAEMIVSFEERGADIVIGCSNYRYIGVELKPSLAW